MGLKNLLKKLKLRRNNNQPVVPPPDPRNVYEQRVPNYDYGTRFDKAANLPGERPGLEMQLGVAQSFAEKGDYVTANKALDDLDIMVDGAFQRLLTKGPAQLDQAMDTMSDDDVNQFMLDMPDNKAKELANGLSLAQFQKLLRRCVNGNVKILAMVNTLSINKIDALSQEKGVDPNVLQSRATQGGRDPEKVKRQAVKLMLKCPSLPPSLVPDISFCGDILADSEETFNLLDPLDKQLKGETDKPKALSKALREKEEEHCFPDVRSLPVGILSGETFLGLTAWGYQPKDPGAGLEHGEFTHRLQWNALMTRFEEDKKQGRPWDHTPLELFTKMGEIDEKASKNGESGTWGAIMDTGGSTINEDTGIEDLDKITEGFKYPDNMTKAYVLLDKKAPGASNLATIIGKRISDRKSEISQYDVPAFQLTMRLENEKKSLCNDVITGVPGALAALQQWLDQNKIGINFGKTKPTEGIVVIKNAKNLAYDMYMEEYKNQKLQSPKYKLQDEGNPDDLLLVGKDSEDLTDEEKRGNVLVLRAESREKFGLPVTFGDPEKQELNRRIQELVAAAQWADPNLEVDPQELYQLAEQVGNTQGLAKALEFAEGPFGDVVERGKQWRKGSRDVIRELRKLQQAFRKRANNGDDVAAQGLDQVIGRLQTPPDQQLVTYLSTDQTVERAEQNDLNVPVTIRSRLVPILTGD